MAWIVFDEFIEGHHNGHDPVDFDTDTLKCMLIDSTREPQQSVDADMALIDNNEVSGDGYTAGGKTLTNVTVSSLGGVTTIDADNLVWTQGATGFTNARYGVIYKSTGTPANDTPICYGDFATDQSNDTNDFTISLASTGIIQITRS